MRLQPLELRLPRVSGSLRRQVEEALALHGRPLRWAITAVDVADPHSADAHPAAILRIEAVLIEHPTHPSTPDASAGAPPGR